MVGHMPVYHDGCICYGCSSVRVYMDVDIHGYECWFIGVHGYQCSCYRYLWLWMFMLWLFMVVGGMVM